MRRRTLRVWVTKSGPGLGVLLDEPVWDPACGEWPGWDVDSTRRYFYLTISQLEILEVSMERAGVFDWLPHGAELVEVVIRAKKNGVLRVPHPCHGVRKMFGLGLHEDLWFDAEYICTWIPTERS